jgi:sirohydrochlorin ferrochelatase
MQHLARLVCNQIESFAVKSNEGASLYASALASPPKCETLVGTASLELAPQPLHEVIRQFALRAGAVGFNRVKILPLFLLPGVHVMEDIPAEVAQAEQTLNKSIQIDLQPHLGSHPGLQSLLANQMADINAAAWVVLSHGSRRPGSQQPVEALAASLGAVAAYWAVAPSLEVRVQELIAAGYKSVGIIPYFLFVGGITDAIARRVEQLKLQSPDISFSMAQPIGASADLANIIWDLIRE